jgi:hypothetical protein
MNKFKFHHPALDFVDFDYEPIILESKNVVCPTCLGEGYHFRSDLNDGDIEYVNDNRFDDFEAEEVDTSNYSLPNRYNRYHQVCEQCKGNRVIKSFDRNDLPEWVIKLIDEYELDARLRAAEKAAGC